MVLRQRNPDPDSGNSLPSPPAAPASAELPPSRRVQRLAALGERNLAWLLWRLAGRRHLALCLHRVHEGSIPGSRVMPWLSMNASVLDRLLLQLLHHKPSDARLTVTFDDGYADAFRYLDDRAAALPKAEFIFYVCPDKTVHRRGFRWDAPAAAALAKSPSRLDELILAPASQGDDEGGTLEGLADAPWCALATSAECVTLQRHKNVRLGNHTNRHLNFATLDDAALQEEVASSLSLFRSVFGHPQDLAIPFGTIGRHFEATQVTMLVKHFGVRVWSTEARPYAERELYAAHAIPRFPVYGGWSVAENLALFVWQTARASHRRGR